jgi:glycosyltransferase involved in cell wall biosynthesis
VRRADRWHVAVVVENVSLGVDTRLRKQVDDLLAAGFRVSVVTMRHPDNEPFRHRDRLRLLEYPAPPEGAGVLGFAREYAVSFGWAAVLLTRLRLRERVDVLQLCQPPDIYFPLAWVMRWAGARVVVDQRDLMPEVLASRGDGGPALLLRLLRHLERRSQRVAHRTVTVNEYLRDRLLRAGATEVDVVRNGPVLRRTAAAVPSPDVRGGADHLLVWAGKMGRQDRVDLVVRLAESLVHERGRTDCRLVVLGDGECLDELRDLSARLGLEPWVTFTGWVDEATVFTHLASADLGVDTSLQEEVSPVKAMEYMSFGLPFVCFDLLESRRLAEGAAVLVPAGDLERLTDEVIGLLDDPGRRQRLGDHGRRRVEQELAWERQVPAYVAAVSPDPLPDHAHQVGLAGRAGSASGRRLRAALRR